MSSILSVRKGDSIVERLANGKKSKTVVTHIAINACSKKGVHINRNACYDNTAEVEIEKAEVSADELEEVFSDEDVENAGFESAIENLTNEQLAELVIKV